MAGCSGGDQIGHMNGYNGSSSSLNGIDKVRDGGGVGRLDHGVSIRADNSRRRAPAPVLKRFLASNLFTQ
jgi:hypothetical protein